jgi:hypothetical protein
MQSYSQPPSPTFLLTELAVGGILTELSSFDKHSYLYPSEIPSAYDYIS